MPARSWEFPLALDRRSDQPQYLQLVRGVVAAIQSGRLRSGQALPGSRTMAAHLGVHRNTVLAGYAELAAEGWVTTTRASGTFVSRDLGSLPSAPYGRHEADNSPALPASSVSSASSASRPSGIGARQFAPPPRGSPLGSASPVSPGSPISPASSCGFAVQPALPYDPPPCLRPGSFLLSKGAPDVRLLPAAEMARAYRRALRREGRRLLGYGDPRGLPQLRAAFAAMLRATRGLGVGPDDVLVTRGSQMALDLAARALVTPGDAVAIEAQGHPAIWTALRLAGARLIPVPIDSGGLDTGALAALLAREPIRAVYVTPHHQFPTTVMMPASRRLHLLELAHRYGAAIIEDDYDHEFHYDGPTVLPLASLDRHASVVYIGTLSKILAPGLRVGFATGPKPVLELMTALRVASDLQGDQLNEWMVAECFQSGELGRHVRRMRRAYRIRRDAFMAALSRELGTALSFETPVGGMALWARVRPDIDLDGWVERAIARGVVMRHGRFYDATGTAPPALRLGFTYHDAGELAVAAGRMAGALAEVEGGKNTLRPRLGDQSREMVSV